MRVDKVLFWLATNILLLYHSIIADGSDPSNAFCMFIFLVCRLHPGHLVLHGHDLDRDF